MGTIKLHLGIDIFKEPWAHRGDTKVIRVAKSKR